MKPLLFCVLNEKLDDKLIKKYSSCNINGNIKEINDTISKSIDNSIMNGSFFNNSKILDVIEYVKENKSNLHVTGLLSDNTNFSNINHLLNLIDIISSKDIKNVYFYIFLEGDVDESAIDNLKKLVKKMKEKNIGTLALVAGKSYMLGNESLDNSKKIYDAICYKIGKKYSNLKEYFKKNYEEKLIIDLFEPGIINETKIENKDAIISFNYDNDNKAEIIDIIANPDNYNLKGLRHFDDIKILSFMDLFDKKVKISDSIKQLRIYSSDKDINILLGKETSDKIKKSNDNEIINTLMEKINDYNLIVINLKNNHQIDFLLNQKIDVLIYDINSNVLLTNNKKIKLKDGNISLIPSTILSLLGKKVDSSLISKNQVGKKTKIFMIVSVLLMVVLFITYLVRFIHYYKVEHPDLVVDNTLVSKIMNTKIVNNNGLTSLEKNYIFKGNVSNNYVLYSGYLFRIVKINEDRTMKLVLDDISNSLVWSYDTDYKDSYAKRYLEEVFLNKLNNYDKYLVDTNWCIDKVKNTDYSCKDKIKSKIGLLTLNDYYLAGLNNGYLNIGKYWWTLNTSKDNKVWYIFSEGGINNESLTNSYGIRPSIVLKNDIEYVSGVGSKEDPYIIDNSKELNIGKYINYSGYKWKIIESNENLKLVLADCLKENDECLVHNFGSNNIYNNKYGSLGYYLNNVFYYNLDNSHLVKGTWYIGDYNEESNYDYNNIFNESFEANVGILNIIENNIENSFTLNRSDDELIYTLNGGSLYSSDPKEELNIYPSIYIDKNFEIKSGSGLINDPYEIGDKVEE